MPRQKPTSLRQKKEEQKLKRAIKRGDAPPPEPVRKTLKRKVKRGPTGQPIAGSSRDANVESVKKLQSSFIRLPQSYLEETRTLASTLPLLRPISDNLAVYNVPSNHVNPTLTCPRRPKWRFDMSKKEVERNEEGLFKKWLAETDRAIEIWRDSLAEIRKHRTGGSSDPELPPPEPASMPPSTTYFERNLEVWRQLWRVTEISQILLVLLDSRCPILHFPPSLSDYLSGKKVILVLTKADIAGPYRTRAWQDYFRVHYPSFTIVIVESYAEIQRDSEAQGKKRYEPAIPINFRESLVEAIKSVHSELLQPPDNAKNSPDRVKHRKAIVKQNIDWDQVLRADGMRVGQVVGGPSRLKEDAVGSSTDEQEPEFLTVGLIGQPNVGKSSLLNALFGASRVHASKTPGKTKHFQTLFWTPEVRLVDCPGLVMPNYISMELQVLCGILPIARLSAVPACIQFAAGLLPLEQIFSLSHPKPVPEDDKRTWREGMKAKDTDKRPIWTGMDVLISYAAEKKWVTAKAGRPDVNRAGNAILRALAEGRIAWAFWPPGTDQKTYREAADQQHAGIWIPRSLSDDDELSSDDEEDERLDLHGSADDGDQSTDSDHSGNTRIDDLALDTNVVGGFGALSIDNVEEDDEDEDEGREDL